MVETRPVYRAMTLETPLDTDDARRHSPRRVWRSCFGVATTVLFLTGCSLLLLLSYPHYGPYLLGMGAGDNGDSRNDTFLVRTRRTADTAASPIYDDDDDDGDDTSRRYEHLVALVSEEKNIMQTLLMEEKKILDTIVAVLATRRPHHHPNAVDATNRRDESESNEAPKRAVGQEDPRLAIVGQMNRRRSESKVLDGAKDRGHLTFENRIACDDVCDGGVLKIVSDRPLSWVDLDTLVTRLRVVAARFSFMFRLSRTSRASQDLTVAVYTIPGNFMRHERPPNSPIAGTIVGLYHPSQQTVALDATEGGIANVGHEYGHHLMHTNGFSVEAATETPYGLFWNEGVPSALDAETLRPDQISFDEKDRNAFLNDASLFSPYTTGALIHTLLWCESRDGHRHLAGAVRTPNVFARLMRSRVSALRLNATDPNCLVVKNV